MNDLEAYIPTKEESVDAYQDLKSVVAHTRTEKGFLTTRQFAMAIIAGLDIWNSRSDVEAIIKELEFLSHE